MCFAPMPTPAVPPDTMCIAPNLTYHTCRCALNLPHALHLTQHVIPVDVLCTYLNTFCACRYVYFTCPNTCTYRLALFLSQHSMHTDMHCTCPHTCYTYIASTPSIRLNFKALRLATLFVSKGGGVDWHFLTKRSLQGHKKIPLYYSLVVCARVTLTGIYCD